jgi:hypothetical protein
MCPLGNGLMFEIRPRDFAVTNQVAKHNIAKFDLLVHKTGVGFENCSVGVMYYLELPVP